MNQTKQFAYMNQIYITTDKWNAWTKTEQCQSRPMPDHGSNALMPEQCPHARAIPMSKHTNVRAN